VSDKHIRMGRRYERRGSWQQTLPWARERAEAVEELTAAASDGKVKPRRTDTGKAIHPSVWRDQDIAADGVILVWCAYPADDEEEISESVVGRIPVGVEVSRRTFCGFGGHRRPQLD
jgi:hypothetical protein